MPKVGRPPVLDEAKKREICALVFAGCGRDVAAQYLGCSRRTIRNAHRSGTVSDRASRRKLRACSRLTPNTTRSGRETAPERAPAFCIARHALSGRGTRPPPASSAAKLRDQTAQLSNALVEALASGCDLRKLLNAAGTALTKTRGQCSDDTRPEPRDVAGPSEFFPRALCNNSRDREENLSPLFPVPAPQSPQNAAELRHPQGNNDGSFGPQFPKA